MGIQLKPGYRPTENEPFMNPKMREFFRQRLLGWKEEILAYRWGLF